MNIIDKIIYPFAPSFVLERIKSRYIIKSIEGFNNKREYDAAKNSRLRKKSHDKGDADSTIYKAGDKIRIQARYLDENHDIAKGILDTLVNKVIGTGITIEPQVKDKNGNNLIEVNNQILELFNEWAKKPETTGELHWNMVQRLIARTLFRDGEVLIQKLEGNIKGLDYSSKVPFLIELIEPDLLPFELNSESPLIIQGVEKDNWNKPIAYHLYKVHPGSINSNLYSHKEIIRKISANNILHPKIINRIGQTRGISIFASVMNRLDDIKDYEESERVASKVAAAMCAYIKKPSSNIVDDETSKDERLMKMQPGMIFDNLMPGEEIGMIDPKRPNTMIEVFLKTQLRGVAAGTYTNYSTISKDYNGTYSAQRQEMVENKANYDVLLDYLINSCFRPIWESFIKIAILSNNIKIPNNVKYETLNDADFRGASVPWIDPQKEIQAEIDAVSAGFKSRSQVIRERGYNPHYVLEQIKQEQNEEKQSGLKFTTTINASNNENDKTNNKDDNNDNKDNSKNNSAKNNSNNNGDNDGEKEKKKEN